MNASPAEQHLAVIRTLMERGTLYRRALGPLFLAAGGLGTVAAVVGSFFNIAPGQPAFAAFWVLTALITLALACFMTRHQALRDREPFWSGPARRVTAAFIPPLLVGGALSAIYIVDPWPDDSLALIATWMILYGCALHASGPFTPRAVRYLGWLFLVTGTTVAAVGWLSAPLLTPGATHLLMGVSFGGFHVAVGLYLVVVRKETNDR